ncbi:Uncharacterised protein [Mycobacterium tuberculosis]|nr:Uncharacterised protein [Mycobacterium tuberculosis]
MAENPGCTAAHEVERQAQLLRLRLPGQLRGERRDAGHRVHGFGVPLFGGVQSGRRLRDRPQQRRGAGKRERGGERGPVDVRDDGPGPVLGEDPLQRRQRQIRVQRVQAAAREVGRGLALGHSAAAPRPPGHARARGQAAGATTGDHPVEERVGRGVGSLASAAPRPGDRGEHDERVEFAVAEFLVQPPGAVDLRRHHVRPVDLLGPRLRDDRSQRGDARGVEDGLQLGLAAGANQLAHLRPVRHVAPDELDIGSGRLQLRGQLCSAVGIRAAARREHDTLGSVLDGPARHAAAEHSGRAGDEYRSAQAGPRAGTDGRRVVGADETPGPHARCVDRHLVLGTVRVARNRQSADQVVYRVGIEAGAAGEIDQSAPQGRRAVERRDTSQAPGQPGPRGGEVFNPPAAVTGAVRDSPYPAAGAVRRRGPSPDQADEARHSPIAAVLAQEGEDRCVPRPLRGFPGLTFDQVYGARDDAAISEPTAQSIRRSAAGRVPRRRHQQPCADVGDGARGGLNAWNRLPRRLVPPVRYPTTLTPTREDGQRIG